MNYKHLHYFWATAHAGGIVRAGERLNTTPQTLSGQIKLLEERFGRRLFRKAGRKLELTDEGRVALGYADEIFQLGAELEAALRATQPARRVIDFRVAVADSVDKTVAYRLLEPAMVLADPVRLVCSEGIFEVGAIGHRDRASGVDFSQQRGNRFRALAHRGIHGHHICPRLNQSLHILTIRGNAHRRIGQHTLDDADDWHPQGIPGCAHGARLRDEGNSGDALYTQRRRAASHARFCQL